MSNLIFSIFVEVNDNSITSYKKRQLLKYHKKLMDIQKHYAEKCNADYKIKHIKTVLAQNEYDSIQFSKLYHLQEYTKQYDNVLYLDIDVIPKYNAKNIFEVYDFNKLVCYFEDCEDRLFKLFPKPNEKYKYISKLDHMSWWIKMAAKNSMLMLEDYKPSNFIINTGVIGANRDIMEQINFFESFDDMHNILEEATEDNLYPPETKQFFKPNNEIFFTFLVEKKNILCDRLDESWNYILDDLRTEEPEEYNLLHMINKDFTMLEHF